MDTLAFLEAIRQIALRRPSYREGGTGADGTCDCIGLIMGAMYQCGRRAYDLHSSNYFARFQTEGLYALSAVDQLAPGMVVYKARNGTDKLNARYLQGGRCFNGDLLDYYHAGVVTGVKPLVITHCTSTSEANGIDEDNSISGWTHCGWVRGMSKTQETADTAVVTALSGSTVNLRSRPHGSLVARIPVGTAVTVMERADGWARVMAEGVEGWMMDTFLSTNGEDCIRIPRSVLWDVINRLRAYAPQETEEE